MTRVIVFAAAMALCGAPAGAQQGFTPKAGTAQAKAPKQAAKPAAKKPPAAAAAAGAPTPSKYNRQ